MEIKVGKQLPYFEFLDGIKGKNLYDLKQKYHIVIYSSEEDFFEDKEEEFEKANIKLIDVIQITTKDFFKNLGIEEGKDFVLVADRYGVVQYISDKVPSFDEIMAIVSFSEDEGCCAL